MPTNIIMLSTKIFSGVAILAAAQTANANCQKYIDAARTAAANLQSAYFINGGYPDQWVRTRVAARLCRSQRAGLDLCRQ